MGRGGWVGRSRWRERRVSGEGNPGWEVYVEGEEGEWGGEGGLGGLCGGRGG